MEDKNNIFNDIKEEDSLKIVDQLVEINNKLKGLEETKAVLYKELINYATQNNVDIIYGSNKKALIKMIDKIIYPEDMDNFITLLKDKGVYNEVIMLNYFKLNSLIIHKKIDSEIIDKIKTEKSHRITFSNK